MWFLRIIRPPQVLPDLHWSRRAPAPWPHRGSVWWPWWHNILLGHHLGTCITPQLTIFYHPTIYGSWQHWLYDSGVIQSWSTVSLDRTPSRLPDTGSVNWLLCHYSRPTPACRLHWWDFSPEICSSYVGLGHYVQGWTQAAIVAVLYIIQS